MGSSLRAAKSASIGITFATIVIFALTSLPASATPRLTVSDPYPIPQSASGVPNRTAVNITATGFTPGTLVYAQLCDGVPPTSAHWSPSGDCGPAEAGEKVPANGNVSFPGTSQNFAILIWHGSNGNDKVFGDQGFNCLAPDDNPNSTVTAQGNQPINPTEPAWGSARGGNAANPAGSSGTSPCQIRITTSLSAYSSSDLFDPINLTATGATSSGSSGSASAAGSTSGSNSQQGASATGAGDQAASGSSASGGQGSSLAQTGAEIAGAVILALALIALGVLIARRSRAKRARSSLHSS